jgi:serine/threonine protein phosphatase 1
MIDIRLIPSPEASDATCVYAVGDVHGRLDLLLQLERLIAEDLAGRGGRPVVCYLGDYIDRGPSSAEVIEHLRRLPADAPRRVFLKGNHEDMMLHFLEDPAVHGPKWFKWGARELVLSYGVEPPDDPATADWAALRDALAASLPPSHLQFLRSLRLGFAWRGWLFVHAGLHPDNPAEAQVERDLMWIREPFLSSARDFGLRIVHGHTVVDEVVVAANRIGLDTGAYRSDRLTALIAEADGRFSLLQTGQAGPPRQD